MAAQRAKGSDPRNPRVHPSPCVVTTIAGEAVDHLSVQLFWLMAQRVSLNHCKRLLHSAWEAQLCLTLQWRVALLKVFKNVCFIKPGHRIMVQIPGDEMVFQNSTQTCRLITWF